MLAYLKAHGELFITLAALAGGLAILITINGNRFDAQDKLIAQRLDAQERLMNQRFEAQDRLMNQRFEQVNQRFEQVNQRFEQVNQRFDRLTDDIAELRRIMVGIGERVSRNEGEIDVIREHLRIADTPSP